MAREDRIETADDLDLGRAGKQMKREVVEGAVQVEDRLQRLARHPQHAETPIVRHQVAGSERIDELRRQGHADDGELPLSPVEDRGEATAGP